MRLLVCGGRGFDDWFKFNQAVSLLPFRPSIVIHGEAKGADSMAKQWAMSQGIYPVGIPALWGKYDKAAGGKRNQAMIDIMKPEYVLAFPGGSGTADMVNRAIKNNITVWEPYK